MIKGYLNQTVLHGRVTDIDKCGEKTTASNKIKCRFEHKTKMIKNAEGRVVIANALIFTIIPLNINDNVTYNNKTYTVVTTESCVHLNGTVSHYESWVV